MYNKLILRLFIAFSVLFAFVTNVFADTYCGVDNLTTGSGNTATTDCNNYFYFRF